jgi:hypothetical protein
VGVISSNTIIQQYYGKDNHYYALFYKYVKLSLDEFADSVASAAVDGLF